MHESAAGVANTRKIEPGLTADLELNAAKARYFLIWITKVSPTYDPDAAGYHLEIDDVTLNS